METANTFVAKRAPIFLDKANIATSTVRKPAFLDYIQNARAVAILFIVAIHCYGILKPEFEPIILQRGTLLFMFISGFLFQYLSKRFEKKTYWYKKVQNILVPYVLVSLPILLIRFATHHHNPDITEVFPAFYTYSLPTQLIAYYVTGMHLVPFWFIPMICFYYLLAPVFVYLDRNRTVYYFLPVFMCLSLLVTRSSDLYRFHLAFIHYISIYLLGMFASRYHKRLLSITDMLWPILIGLTAAFLVLGTVFNQKEIRFIEQFLYCQKLLICWTIIYLLWKFNGKIMQNKFLSTNLTKLSNVSFALYFLHYYFLYFIDYLMQEDLLNWQPTFFNSTLIFAADLLFCFAAISVIKAVAGNKSKYFMGY
ncbi:acyltransferase [Hymenobacter aerilatus]|uniref:Acyltransferase n=1 Tax=Hymenobacter aerilatus TaxID=2932251 RepID=A0A8T9SY59_9BACT|nr:acyltransferase [Hymenobacter aerilatus]UOR05663.1 acyltransferase [Hymenobacter aerilatus]